MTDSLTRERYNAARATIQSAAAAYYGDGTSSLTDAQYDALMAQVATHEQQHPDITDPIASKVAAGAGLVGADGAALAHSVPMLSLDNAYSKDEFTAWVQGLAKRIGKDASDIRFAVEPKLDGLAMAIRYVDGRPVAMLKRGDGITGEDATAALGDITNLPAAPVSFTGVTQFEVRGEVVFTRDDFHAANLRREVEGDAPFANPRNGAAGAVAGAATRKYRLPLAFFAYDVVGLPNASHTDLMSDLAHAGFATARALLTEQGAVNLDEAIREIEVGLWEASGDARLPMDCDGMVIKADLPGDRATAGSGSRAPRWAIAYKYPSQEVTSRLLEVTWAVGRTGVIAPRARIEPVAINGVRVEFTTLHNPGDIARKGFMLGDTVLVRRAGEVIPRLEAPVPEHRDGTQTPIEIPAVCPQCGGPINTSGARLLCAAGRDCGTVAALEYAVSRDALDIEGVSSATVAKMVASGAWLDLASIFTQADQNVLVTAGGVAPANAPKIIAQIEKAKEAGFARVLTALGILGTGRSMSRRLARHFGSMNALLAASVEALAAVDGIGDVKAASIHNQLADPALRSMIERLHSAGVQMGDQATATTESATDSADAEALPLHGLTVVVTGSMVGALAGLSRNEVNELIERHGGRASSSVSKTTGLLVVGQKAGSKLAKAESLGVTVATEDQFAAMIG